MRGTPSSKVYHTPISLRIYNFGRQKQDASLSSSRWDENKVGFCFLSFLLFWRIKISQNYFSNSAKKTNLFLNINYWNEKNNAIPMYLRKVWSDKYGVESCLKYTHKKPHQFFMTLIVFEGKKFKVKTMCTFVPWSWNNYFT